MNTSSREMPVAASAMPTPSSLRYAAAVSIWRYPAASASSTAFWVSAGGTWKTPKPSWGMVWPSFRVTVGTEGMDAAVTECS